MEPTKPRGLIVAIIFAAVIISGSLIFLGYQLSPGGSSQASVLDDTFTNDEINTLKKLLAGTQDPQAKAGVGDVKAVDPKKDHIRGNLSAPISVIEYSDFECPFCKKVHPTLQQVVDSYDGQVNWVYRHFPLSFHDPLATKEAEATECAAEQGGNDAFWAYADLIFETTTSNGRGMTLEQLPELAAQIGLDKDQFKTCLESGKYTSHVQQDIQEGSAAGVSGTPGNIVINNTNGEAKMVSGAQPFTGFKSAIDALLP